MTTASNVRYGPGSKNLVDVYYNKLDTETLKPVVIFIHGGAWVKGDKYNFIEVGAALARNNYVAFLPNYTLFPEGNIEDMVDDIHRIIRWVWYYGYIYGGDRDRIHLVAYSAGAHITALTIVKTALKMYNKGEVIGILPRLEKLVLISGPYDLNNLNQVTKMLIGRDLESGLIKKIFDNLFNSPYVSPTTILQDLIRNNANIDFGMPKMIFYYSDEDQLIPKNSATDLMNQINRVSPSTEIIYYYDEGYHSTHDTLMMGARDGVEKYQRAFFILINS
ncbi:alpha/beta-hydrolase [Piromyces finnis]|uniref:Alpha/beta-hydrolase n=1 Tax=Piromyces finnis TaxID=1754191 RepID=A0A1Y1V377_9FUNG|nr:alpha/beta-hydrolase [Piromyces finnis]|eukprot:ORX46251.1 alpha/beta-hydrolase [Piromyces finnis]